MVGYELETLEVREKVSDILGIPISQISFNPIKNTVVIELKRNRHVTICSHQLKYLKEEFECDDIILSSPYRCVIVLKLWYHNEIECCSRKCKCENTVPLDYITPLDIDDIQEEVTYHHRIFKAKREPISYNTMNNDLIIWFDKCSKIVGYSYKETSDYLIVMEFLLHNFERDCDNLLVNIKPKAFTQNLTEISEIYPYLESYNTKREEILSNG